MKRSFDLILSSLLLALLAPVLLVIACLVRRFLGQPVLFCQDRPGLNGEIFQLLKFRTMREPIAGEELSDAQRLTRFGAWLRRTSLDELPELWNIATGDMSFVGPRPLLVEYLPLYSRTQTRRHETRPGLTGWAQIHGRNDLEWDERFRLDVWYVDHRSLRLDLKILLRTVGKVWHAEGVNQSGSATAEKFRGSAS